MTLPDSLRVVGIALVATATSCGVGDPSLTPVMECIVSEESASFRNRPPGEIVRPDDGCFASETKVCENSPAAAEAGLPRCDD